ncbi:class I SAM-dependent methyltransferase [Mycoplasmatota bacterium WC30]
MINIVELSHKLLDEFDNPNIAIDMTCGNGYDTLFLAKKAKKVYAFDIQDEAINNTLKLLEENKINNVTVLKESHDLFDIFVSENFDLAIYNLGYLPSGNKDIKTNSRIVINSLEKALEMMNSKAIIIIVIYLHDSDENIKISDFVSKLDRNYDVIKYMVLNKDKSPYIIKISKI